MDDLAVRCEGIRKHYGTLCAVDGVSLALARGHILALLGPSGCGKTTILRLLAGLEEPEAGTIEIGGRLVAGPGVYVPPERRRVGMVFQDYALFPHLTVADNVGYGLGRGEARGARVGELLGLVGLAGLGARLPHELSGGQQQRVALARALAPRPEIVLLDEPFSNLDAALRGRLRREVQDILRAAGASAVFVTHDQEEALSLADEVALLLDGRIEQVAPPETLYLHPATRAAAAFLGDADWLPGHAAGGLVDCALGVLSSPGAAPGAVDVLLRPEAVALTPDGSAPHRIVRREYLGREVLVTVRLASGDLVRSRLLPQTPAAVGDRVRVEVAGPVAVFPAGLANGSAAAPADLPEVACGVRRAV